VEAKAAASGDSLPTSTIASALGRSTLPREYIVEAMARACGLDDADVRRWLEARQAIASGTDDTSHSGQQGLAEDGDGTFPPPRASRLSARLVVPVLIAAVVAGLGIGAYILFLDDDRTTLTPNSEQLASTGPPVPGLTMGAVGSWAEIRAAAAPNLCLTEGRDTTGRYPHVVAALRPCEEAVPPRTYLRPLGDGLVQIQWHHPVHGIGCLVALSEGVAKNLIEPWESCDEERLPQVFRMELVGPPDSRRYRFHPTHSGMCIGISRKEVVDGREATHGPCTGEVDQEFVIELRTTG
jgi:hypothetical protein